MGNQMCVAHQFKNVGERYLLHALITSFSVVRLIVFCCYFISSFISRHCVLFYCISLVLFLTFLVIFFYLFKCLINLYVLEIKLRLHCCLLLAYRTIDSYGQQKEHSFASLRNGNNKHVVYGEPETKKAVFKGGN